MGNPRLIAAAGGAVVTAGLLALVLSLGGWAYHHRQWSLHDGRLRRAVEKHPTAGDMSAALLAEPGMRAIPVPADDARLAGLAAEWSPARSGEVVARRRKWRELRAFGVQDVAYFLYFDDQGRLQDYVLLGR